jgi:hypothetical protein
MPTGTGTSADMIMNNPHFQAGWYEESVNQYVRF